MQPVISKQTIDFHYGKHHRAYVSNLNGLIPGTKFENATLEQIIREAEGGILNNGAQIWNHTFYFGCFSPKGPREPTGALSAPLTQNFGSFSEFKDQFSKAAATLFGSGWVWLVKMPDGKLSITQEQNAGNPLKKGQAPLLTCDVWEHAYYLDYQNRRPDYIKSFWSIIDWEKIAKQILIRTYIPD